jgi:ankyrin repeat protein
MKVWRSVVIVAMIVALGTFISCGKTPEELTKDMFDGIKAGDAAAVAKAIEKGAVVNNRAFDETPLAMAIGHGNMEVVAAVIAGGANVDEKDNYKTPTLYMAALKENAALVKLLVDAGAKVDVPDKTGKTPLMAAVNKGNLEIVKLLMEKGAKFAEKVDGTKMPFYLAIKKGNIPIVTYMLGKGADINMRDSKEAAPLHYAAWGGNMKMVEFLFEKGAKKDIKATDKFDCTPMWFAKRYKKEEVEKFLKKAGARW